MATQGLEVTPTKESTHIKWQDLIDVSSYPKAELPKVTAALEQIESTKNGQQLFSAMFGKQHSKEYANGAYFDQKLIFLNNGKADAMYDENRGTQRMVHLDTEKIKDIVFFTTEGKTVKPLLSDIVFHELAHASDANHELSLELGKKRAVLFKETEVIMTDKKQFMEVNEQSEFFKSLTYDQQNALTSLAKIGKDSSIHYLEY